MTEIGEKTVLHKGHEVYVEWKIPDIDFLWKEDYENYEYWSPGFFSFEGEDWFFVIYLKGSEDGDSARYMDLCLFRDSSRGPPIHVDFSVSLRTVKGENDPEKRGTEVFKGGTWSYLTDRLLLRQEYRRRTSELVSSSGYLTIVCTLKRHNPTETELELLRKEQQTAQSLLEKTVKEKDEIKRDLDAYKTENEKLMKVKSDLESELATLRDGETHASGSSEVCHHDKILRDFKQLYFNQEDCDVVLKLRGKEFHAHKIILAARSPVFASTFRNEMKEKETGIVDIEDCDPFVFPDFLSFLYSDDLNGLSHENVFGLFTAADKYDVADLRNMCLEFMKGNLSVKIFCETLTLALQHSETELIQLVTNFFIKHAEKILVTVQWRAFVAENPTQSNELFIKFMASDRCLKS